MTALAQDLRFAVRMLLKNPGFTLAAVATLALGIGLNTAIFSMVNAVLFKPVPFNDAERLVTVHRQSLDDYQTHAFSYPDYCEFRDNSGVFDGLATCHQMRVSVSIGGTTTLQTARMISGNYFLTFGVHAGHGRLLCPADDQTPGAHPVVVISHPYWQRAFDADPAVIGQTIVVNGHAFTVVGVSPQSFADVGPTGVPDLWVPMMMQPQLMPGPERIANRNISWLHLVIGRLKPEVDESQVQARLDAVSAHLKELHPDHYENERAFAAPLTGLGLPPEGRRIGGLVSILVMATVALVLLIACANVANLLLARSTARSKEIGVRLALGAGRWRLVRQLLTESVLVALLGGAIGMLLASWVVDLLPALMPPLPIGGALAIDFGIDVRVLAFTLAVSVLVGVIFGLVPALNATRVSVASVVKEGAGTAGPGVKRSRLQGALVIGQVAVSLTLLISAGLFVRSLLKAKSFDAGFDHQKVLAVSLDLNLHDYDSPNGQTFYRQLLERVSALPGVKSAGLDAFVPLGGTTMSLGYWTEGRPDHVSMAYASFATPGVFETLGIPLLRGRDFTDHDAAGGPRVVIINKALADQAWPGEDPIGKRIGKHGPEGPWLEVVGVSNNVKYSEIEELPQSLIYEPFAQQYLAGMTLLVRTEGEPAAVLPGVRAIVYDLDASVAPVDMRTLTDVVADKLLPAKMAAALFGLFGALALVLASVGLYGVMSFIVGQRTHEIGVRVALGARRRDVVRLVLAQGLRLTVVGVGIGLAFSLAGSFVLASVLYGVGAGDPLSFAGVSFLLVAVAALACYIPARRAARVDPMVALRYE